MKDRKVHFPSRAFFSFFVSFLQVLDSIYKECRKENPTYKMAALKCFGEIVQEYSIDRFQQLSELLFPIIAPVSFLFSSINILCVKLNLCVRYFLRSNVSSLFKGDVKRGDSQRRFLAQHSVATLLRLCLDWLQHFPSVAALCCAKNRRCESSRVTSP